MLVFVWILVAFLFFLVFFSVTWCWCLDVVVLLLFCFCSFLFVFVLLWFQSLTMLLCCLVVSLPVKSNLTFRYLFVCLSLSMCVFIFLSFCFASMLFLLSSAPVSLPFAFSCSFHCLFLFFASFVLHEADLLFMCWFFKEGDLLFFIGFSNTFFLWCCLNKIHLYSEHAKDVTNVCMIDHELCCSASLDKTLKVGWSFIDPSSFFVYGFRFAFSWFPIILNCLPSLMSFVFVFLCPCVPRAQDLLVIQLLVCYECSWSRCDEFWLCVMSLALSLPLSYSILFEFICAHITKQ